MAKGATRQFSIIAINDVYRLDGVAEDLGGRRGGLARVRTLRRELEAQGQDVLVTLAGDFLFPSLPSRVFRGAQMVDGLNFLDGGPGFDEGLLVTFGNHEFDRRKLSQAADLQARLDESEFSWLGTNLVFGKDEKGKAWVGGDRLIDTWRGQLGGIEIGAFSITLEEGQPAYVDAVLDPLETARRAVAELRQAGAEVVIALTHQEVSADLEQLRALGEGGPDLVLGGHEHNAQRHSVDGRWVLKADADAATAFVVTVEETEAGGFRFEPRLVPLGPEKPAPDATLAARATGWEQSLDRVFCAGTLSEAIGCLDRTVGRTSTLLGGEELRIRRFETSLGNWVADVMKDASPRAQGAFMNAGSLRLNRNIGAGAELKRQDIEELLAYPSPLRLIRINGRTLQEVLSRSIEGWTGNGWWLQVSGIAFRHDPIAGVVSDLTLLTESGPRPIAADEELLLITQSYLLEPETGQDGYTMLRPEQVIEELGELKDLLLERLQAAEPEGIAPRVEGRICNEQGSVYCLAVAAKEQGQP